MAIIDLPPNLRITDRGDPHLSPLNRSGGQAMNGEEQVIGTGAARWVWNATLLVRNAADARSWRQAKSLLEGRVNYLRTHVCDRYRLNRREIGAYPFTGEALPHSDGSFYSDGSGHELEQPNTILTADAAEGATAISIAAPPLGSYMSNGLFFSIDDWLYQVVGWELEGLEFNLTIKPGLKAAAANLDQVLFDPRALWVVASDDEGQVSLSQGRFGAIQLSLIEAIGRDT